MSAQGELKIGSMSAAELLEDLVGQVRQGQQAGSVTTASPSLSESLENAEEFLRRILVVGT